MREYLIDLVADLTSHYPIHQVELESFAFEGFPHFHSHEKIGIQFGPTDRFLLGLYFCRCCQGVARKLGADVEGAGRLVGNTLIKAFESGQTTPVPLHEFVGNARIFQPYLAAREWTIASRMAELRKACRSKLVFMHFLT